MLGVLEANLSYSVVRIKRLYKLKLKMQPSPCQASYILV
jgi:hypothetical protein